VTPDNVPDSVSSVAPPASSNPPRRVALPADRGSSSPVASPVSPKTAGKRSRTGLDLSSFDAEIDAEEERKRVVESQGPPPELKHEQIAALLPALRNEALAHKPSVAALLREDNFRVEGHKWIVEVPNPFGRQQLTNEREALVDYVRRALNHPAVAMEVVVVESSVPEEPNRPMTAEEKRILFHELNPAVRLLEETFNTQIDYGV
jgi:hypothetical protein